MVINLVSSLYYCVYAVYNFQNIMNPQQRPLVDIVIPVYNEGKNILATLAALSRDVQTPCRVLICYDFDGDDTLPVAKAYSAASPELRVEFVKNKSRGAHAAVMTGFAASTAPYVLMYPADDDYNSGILDSMVAQATLGADVVCASRFMPGGSMVGCPFFKSLLVQIGNGVLYYIARVPTHDASNGFRLFSHRVLKTIPVESTKGFCYSIEYLVKAHRVGLRIDEVPAHWYERQKGTSRFRIIRWLPAYIRWCLYAFGTMLRRIYA